MLADMQRAVVSIVGLLLLGPAPVMAQDVDPFREVAPTGDASFQTAPAAPEPKSAPRVRRAPEPEPLPPEIVALPHPTAPPSPANLDGVYLGAIQLVDNPNFYRYCSVLNTARKVVIQGGDIKTFGNTKMTGKLETSGKFSALGNGFRIDGKIENGKMVGKLQNVCGYSFSLTRQ